MIESLESSLFKEFACNKESLSHRYKIIYTLRKYIYKALSTHYVKIFDYGSLPLKTYITGGDIDLTLIVSPSSGQSTYHILAQISLHLESLAKERQELQIQDLRIIPASVQVLKFQIYGIPVDLSVNQIGGLKTLCFLEATNRLLPFHFVKRSIVICKIWAKYYGGILGSANGLFSTYALEILVLYVINTCEDAQRSSPLKILETFIRTYASFDWNNQVVAIRPSENFLTQNYLDNIKHLRNSSTSDSFHYRALNIEDPLDSSNNLGRSVSSENAMWISEIFAYYSVFLDWDGKLFGKVLTDDEVYDLSLFNTRANRLRNNLQESISLLKK